MPYLNMECQLKENSANEYENSLEFVSASFLMQIIVVIKYAVSLNISAEKHLAKYEMICHHFTTLI